MAIPSLVSRPEKTIDGVVSRWNAARLPIQYVLSNTKWPVNTEDDVDDFSSVTSDNGYARIVLDSTYETYVAKEWIIIDGSTNYDGVHRIRSISGLNVTLDTAYVATDTGTFQRYYQNYTSVVEVYAGIPSGHSLSAQKPIALIGTIEQRPNTDNNTYVDVRRYILSKLSTFNDIDGVGIPNDVNLWTGFYIIFAERYDSVSSGTIVNFLSSNTSDVGDPCYASQSALQFQNQYGGNMFLYSLQESPYGGPMEFMTKFTRPTLFTSSYFDISFINDDDTGTLLSSFTFKEYDINNTELATQSISISDQDVGLYRIRLDGYTFNASTKYIKIFQSSTELITIDIKSKCTNQDLPLTWLNSLGGWDHWTFTARKTYNRNPTNVQNITRDIFQDWDDDFIQGQTIEEHISMESFKTVVVRSQNLTRAQAEAVSYIKDSIKVQDMTDPNNPITVMVDKGSIAYTADQAKTNFIEFTITYPQTYVQQQ